MKWIFQLDKMLHISISFIILATLDYFMGIEKAMAITIAIGTIKELYDYYHPLKHRADIMDLIADMLGVLVYLIGKLMIW